MKKITGVLYFIILMAIVKMCSSSDNSRDNDRIEVEISNRLYEARLKGIKTKYEKTEWLDRTYSENNCETIHFLYPEKNILDTVEFNKIVTELNRNYCRDIIGNCKVNIYTSRKAFYYYRTLEDLKTQMNSHRSSEYINPEIEHENYRSFHKTKKQYNNQIKTRRKYLNKNYIFTDCHCSMRSYSSWHPTSKEFN